MELWKIIFELAIYPGSLGTFNALAAVCSWWRDICTLLMISPEPIIHLNQDVCLYIGLSPMSCYSVLRARDIIEAAGPHSGAALRVKEIIGRSDAVNHTILVVQPFFYGYAGFKVLEVKRAGDIFLACPPTGTTTSYHVNINGEILPFDVNMTTTTIKALTFFSNTGQRSIQPPT